MDEKIYRVYTLSSSDEPDRVRYVGITQSTLKIRFQGHKGKARGKNPSQPVHLGMRKKYSDGLEIICKEIDTCDESKGKEKETYGISYYRKIEPELLNIQNGGNGVITAEMRTIEGRERTRMASIRPVAACDESLNIIKEFESLTAAAKYYNISKGNIGAALKNNGHCNKLRWIYLEKQIDPTTHIKQTNPDYNKRIIVYKFDINNNLVQTYQSIRQVIRDLKGENCTQSGDYFRKNILDKNKLYESYYGSTDENFKINDTHFIWNEVQPNGQIIDKFKFKTEIAKKFNVSINKINYMILKNKPLPNGNFIQNIKI